MSWALVVILKHTFFIIIIRLLVIVLMQADAESIFPNSFSRDKYGQSLYSRIKQRAHASDPFRTFCHCFDVMILIATIPAFAAKTWEVLLWRHDIHDVFPRNWTNALQNLQFFFHNFTMKFNIFSLNLTGDSDFLILSISAQNKLSTSRFQ